MERRAALKVRVGLIALASLLVALSPAAGLGQVAAPEIIVEPGKGSTPQEAAPDATPQEPAPPVTPEVAPEAAAEPSATVTRTGVEELLKQVEALSNITEEVRQQSQEFARQALDDLATVDKLQQAAVAHRTGLERIPVEAADLRNAVIPEPEVKPDATIPEVEARMTEIRPLISELQQRLTQPQIDPATRVARRKVIRTLLAETPSQLQTIEQQQAVADPEGQPPALTALRRASLLARKQMLTTQLTTLGLERELYDAEDAVGLPRLRSDHISRRVTAAQKQLELLTAQLNALRQKEAADRIAAAQSSFLEARPELRELVEENRSIAQEEAETRRLQQSAQGELQRVNEQLDYLQGEYDEALNLEELIGLTGAMGLKLRKRRAELPDPATLDDRMADRVQKLERSQLAVFEKSEQADDLVRIDLAAEEVVAASGLTGEQAESIRQQAERFLEERRDFLDSLIKAHSDYTEVLTDLDVKERILAQRSEEFADFIDERILWIRSHQPMTLRGIVQDRHVLSWLVEGAFWADLWRILKNDVEAHYTIYLAAFLVLLTLIKQHRRQAQLLREASTAASSRVCTSLTPTLQAVLSTTLLALLWPSLMWFVAWRLGNTADTPIMLQRGVSSLGRLAALFLLLELVRQSLRPED